jgi:CheY-like chemotaxis protein
MSDGVNPSETAPSDDEPPPLQVLLVEDFPDLAAATVEFLEAQGLRVRMALTGQEALDLASAVPPQLVLCDMRLPDMTGFDVVRGLRSNSATRQVYVVVLSALDGTEPTLQSEAAHHGVDAIIAKPITVEAVRRFVEATRGRLSNDRDSPGDIDRRHD